MQVLVEEVRSAIADRLGHDDPLADGARARHRGRPGSLARLVPNEPVSANSIPSQPAGQRARKASGSRPSIGSRRRARSCSVVGNDARGVLFGVGRLLLTLRMARATWRCRTSSTWRRRRKYPLRGHQLGYRPKTNSYDAWDLPQWDRYIRDLAVFGTNAIELIPPRSDDDADSPHFPAAADGDDGRHVADLRRLRARRLDLVSGDGRRLRRSQDGRARARASGPRSSRSCRGSTPSSCRAATPGTPVPRYLMALLEKQADNLRRYHPKAQMWVSPQSFSREWLDEFLALMQAEPAWLSGVVFGPQVRVSLPELRKAVPAKYPIRDYPDITHSLRCQYPVPDWDVAYSLTEGREVINPRPRDEVGDLSRVRRPDDRLHHLFGRLQRRRQQDRLERAGLGPGGRRARRPARLRPLLHRPDRSRGRRLRPRALRPGAELARAAARPMARSRRRSSSSALWSGAPRPRVLANWRFQQALYRAYYDAYVRSRLIYETDLEEQALDRAAQRARARVARWRWTRPRRSWTGPSRSRSPPTCARGSSSWPRRCFRASACN